MSRKISRPQQSDTSGRAAKGQAIENSDKNVKFVQLKLPAKLAEEIEDEGEKALRSLPVEILHRLLNADDGLAAYGWSQPERSKALADATGTLAGDIFDSVAPITDDPMRDRGQGLAMLKIAVSDVLDSLGATELSDEQTALAHSVARMLINDIQRVEPDPALYTQRPQLAVLARLAKAWGLREGAKVTHEPEN